MLLVLLPLIIVLGIALALGLLTVIALARLVRQKTTAGPVQYTKARITFVRLFLLSLGPLALSILGVILVLGSGFSPPPGQAGTNINIIEVGSLVAALTSCLTSITTFIGFIISTILGVRKESREAKMAEIERRRHEMELERQRFELDKMREEMRQQSKGKKPKPGAG